MNESTMINHLPNNQSQQFIIEQLQHQDSPSKNNHKLVQQQSHRLLSSESNGRYSLKQSLHSSFSQLNEFDLQAKSKNIQNKGHSKNQLISILEKKNKEMTTEIQNIWEKMNSKVEQKSLKKRSSLHQSEVSLESLNMELKTAYQLIKNIETEIKWYRSKKQINLHSSERINILNNDLDERKKLSKKLKAIFDEETKRVLDNQKKLNNHAIVEEIQLIEKSSHNQHSYFVETVKTIELKEKLSVHALKKQYTYIKNLEKELQEKGFSESQLEEMKLKCILQHKKQKYLSTKRHQTEINQKQLQSKTDQMRIKHSVSNQNQQQQIQDRSKPFYQEILKQIKILQKVTNEHDKLFKKTIIEFQNKKYKNQKKIQSLENVQKEIQFAEKRMFQIQDQVKINKSFNIFNPIKQANKKRFSLETKREKSQRMHSQALQRSKSKKSFSERLKTQLFQKKKSLFKPIKRENKNQKLIFDDRSYLSEKRNLKIIGALIYIDNNKDIINGLKIYYENDKNGEDHMHKNVNQINENYSTRQLKCEQNDFVTTILLKYNLLNQLSFISFKTKNMIEVKSKETQKQQQNIQFNKNSSFQFNAENGNLISFLSGTLCFHEQLSNDKNKYEYSTLENLGFEIKQNNQLLGQNQFLEDSS